MRLRALLCGVGIVVSSYGCPRPATCPPGEVLLPEGCALDCPPGSTTGCRDTGVPTDAADVRDGGASTMDVPDVTDVADVVDATPGPDVVDVSLACDGGETACMGRCVATQTDTMNCGACANVCPSSAGSAASCVMGACRATCIPGYEMVGSACEVIAPRPVFPPGTSTVTNLRPTLKWALPMGVDGAEVELCRDRACTMMIERVTAMGASARPMADLPRSSVVFWRVRGRVGATTGTRTSPTWQFRTRATSTTVDSAYGTELDVNGDGFTDLAVVVLNGGPTRNGSIQVFHGSATGLPMSANREIALPGPSGFVPRVNAAGDVDGDGFGDLLVGLPATGAAGTAYIFAGTPAGIGAMPTTTLSGVSSGDRFGDCADGIGDVNGDGFGDIGVCSSRGDVGAMTDVGTVSVFRGRAVGVDTTASQTLGFVTNAARAGDVNGDGFADLVAGNPSYSGSGRLSAGAAYVLHGSPTGVNSVPALAIEGTAAGEELGQVGFAGDPNGDGFADVAIAAPLASPGGRMNAGRLSVHIGSMLGVRSTPLTSLEGAVVNERLGTVFGSMGDVNGDGFGDFATSFRTGGANNEGVVTVYRGGASGLSAAASQTLQGVARGDRFGFSLTSGHYWGGTFADVVVGADFARMAVGVAYQFRGGTTGVASVAVWSVAGTIGGDELGIALAQVGEWNQRPHTQSSQSGSSIFHTPSSRTSCIVKRLPTP